MGKALQLRADVGRSVPIEEPGIAQLLNAGVHECPAEEQPQWEESHHAHYGR
jgi:hypothetical protein